MATTRTTRKAVVTCVQCEAVLGAEMADDGSFEPLGTEEDCLCGSQRFRRLR